MVHTRYGRQAILLHNWGQSKITSPIFQSSTVGRNFTLTPIMRCLNNPMNEVAAVSFVLTVLGYTNSICALKRFDCLVIQSRVLGGQTEVSPT